MDSDFLRKFCEIRIAGRYQLQEHLGSGTFGRVYLGRDIYNGDEVAIKLEHYSIVPSFLEQEIDIYESLKGASGFPRVYWHGHQDDFRVMVFELLGPNLEDLFRYCNNRFSMKTTLILMDQILQRMKSLHTAGYHHRDIKPENFLLGTGKQGNIVHITDLGLAVPQPFLCEQATDHIPNKEARLSLVGTCRYASINGHFDKPSSSRDDLESLGYMVLYLLHGSLPWQGLQAANLQEKYQRVSELKQRTSVHDLCGDLPTEFATYMKYVHQLRDQDRPNYTYLRKLFRGLFQRLGFEYDYVFDWTIREFARLSGTAQ